jgi:hypothetical protein
MQCTVLLLVVVGLFFTACGASTPEGQMRDPFSARSVGEDGIVVEWSGYTEGYRPNPGPYEHYSVDLSFKNESDTEWRGRVCFSLLDGQGVIADLGRREFSLDPGAAMGTPYVLRFPAELAAGAYGLTLVVHRPEGPFVNTVAIRIGDTTEIYDSQESAYQAALNDCPAPLRTHTE